MKYTVPLLEFSKELHRHEDLVEIHPALISFDNTAATNFKVALL